VVKLRYIEDDRCSYTSLQYRISDFRYNGEKSCLYRQIYGFTTVARLFKVFDVT